MFQHLDMFKETYRHNILLNPLIPITMSTEKKRNPDKKKDSKKNPANKKSALDKELDQTFPASDPPAHTRPGSKRDDDDKKK